MKIVNINEIHKNSILARAVVNENGNILLYEGAEIRPEHIKKLIDNNITSVYIKENENDNEIDSFSVEAIEQDSLDMIKDVVEKRIREDDDTEIGKLVEEASKIIQDIIATPEITQCMINIKRKKLDMYSHMLNVASLSVIMAMKIGLDETQINDIAKGALLHDIGLCDVGVPFENVEIERMPAADKLNYRKHVIHGYELLQKYDWMTETANLIVLSHHERIDGSGYPFHKVGERIPIEVKLVSICDHFDELVNGIGYKRRKVHEVVEFFRTNGAYIFDYELLSKIIVNIAWFPTGTQVITNEGETAEVIKQNKGLPDRPVLRIIKTNDGKACTDNIEKDLTEHLTVFIMDTVE